MKLDESFASVLEEVGQGRVAVRRERDLVVFRPHDDADQRDVDVEGRVEGVHHVCNVFADPVNLFHV